MKQIIIDTNLLVLLIVGLTDCHPVGSFSLVKFPFN